MDSKARAGSAASHIPECMVCFSQYNLTDNLPMLLLPCGHGVCRACVTALPECPLDRSVITQTMLNRPMRDAIESLLSRVPEAASPSSTASSSSSGSTADGSPPGFARLHPELPCPKHAGQTIEYFCPDDLQPCCLRCCVHDHHGHGKPLDLGGDAIEQSLSSLPKNAVEQVKKVYASSVEVDRLVNQINTESELLINAVRRQQDALLQKLLPPAAVALGPQHREAALQQMRQDREDLLRAAQEVETSLRPRTPKECLTLLQSYKMLAEKLRQDAARSPPIDLSSVRYDSANFQTLHAQITQGWATWRAIGFLSDSVASSMDASSFIESPSSSSMWSPQSPSLDLSGSTSNSSPLTPMASAFPSQQQQQQQGGFYPFQGVGGGATPSTAATPVVARGGAGASAAPGSNQATGGSILFNASSPLMTGSPSRPQEAFVAKIGAGAATGLNNSNNALTHNVAKVANKTQQPQQVMTMPQQQQQPHRPPVVQPPLPLPPQQQQPMMVQHAQQQQQGASVLGSQYALLSSTQHSRASSAASDASSVDNALANDGNWYRGKVSGMLHALDGFITVVLNDKEAPLSVYYNLAGGRVTTKNATGFEPRMLEVGREVWVELTDNPDQQRAREEPTKRFVARSMKLGDPMKKPKMVRGTISVIMHDGKDGFINVVMSDGKTEYKVYYSLSVNSRFQTINVDNTIDPMTLRVGTPVLVELMDNPEMDKRTDSLRKYVARAVRATR